MIGKIPVLLQQYQKKFLEYYRRGREFLSSERFFSFIACLPVFFGWLIPITWKAENERLCVLSIDCMILSATFWILILLGVFLSWIPVIGAYLANVAHFVGILVYPGLSFYFLYQLAREREIPDLPILKDLREKVRVFLR